jgi:hypothetical protein
LEADRHTRESNESSSRGDWQAGFITTLSVSPFVVSLRASSVTPSGDYSQALLPNGINTVAVLGMHPRPPSFEEFR